MSQHTKDPDSTLDFTRNWKEWLEPGETIAASEWYVSGPNEALKIGSGVYAPTKDDTTTTVWLIGGTVGASYRITNKITTSNSPPRIDERTFQLKISQR